MVLVHKAYKTTLNGIDSREPYAVELTQPHSLTVPNTGSKCNNQSHLNPYTGDNVPEFYMHQDNVSKLVYS